MGRGRRASPPKFGSQYMKQELSSDLTDFNQTSARSPVIFFPWVARIVLFNFTFYDCYLCVLSPSLDFRLGWDGISPAISL